MEVIQGQLAQGVAFLFEKGRVRHISMVCNVVQTRKIAVRSKDAKAPIVPRIQTDWPIFDVYCILYSS